MKKPAVLVAALALLGVGVWYGGVWLTHQKLIDAPWVVPSGIRLEGEPQIGVPYKVSVYTHCGLRHVEFDADTWAISGVVEDGAMSPPDGFDDPTDEGTVTLTGPDTAIWHSHFGERRELARGGGLPYVEGCL